MFPDFRTLVTGALDHLEHDRPAEAEKNLRAALAMNPRDDQLLHLLGVSLIRQEREEEAIEPLKKAISLNRRDAEYHNALGVALRNTYRIDEGVESFLRALKLAPDLYDAHYNLALAHQHKGDFANGEQRLRYLLARNPADIEAINALVNGLWFVGDYEQALQVLRDSIQRVPGSGDLPFGLGERLLALGRFEEGWFYYLWRVNRNAYLTRFGLAFNSPELLTPYPASLEGRTVRVHAEQGIGDDLFFLRYVPLLRARGARVVGAVTPRLLEMIRRSGVLDECEPAPERIPPSSDYRFLADLPYLLQAHTLPLPPPVRFAPLPERTDAVRAMLAALPRPLIGLTWRAGAAASGGNRNYHLSKEVPFAKFVAMAQELPGTLAVLQREPGAGEVEQLRAACGPRVSDFSALNADLETMHALLAEIDDYLGVSNTNTHLRAALGRSQRVLVSKGLEFRWMAEGDASPWFPGFPVYRQGPGRDWAPALEAAARDVRNALGSSSGGDNVRY